MSQTRINFKVKIVMAEKERVEQQIQEIDENLQSIQAAIWSKEIDIVIREELKINSLIRTQIDKVNNEIRDQINEMKSYLASETEKANSAKKALFHELEVYNGIIKRLKADLIG